MIHDADLIHSNLVYVHFFLMRKEGGLSVCLHCISVSVCVMSREQEVFLRWPLLWRPGPRTWGQSRAGSSRNSHTHTHRPRAFKFGPPEHFTQRESLHYLAPSSAPPPSTSSSPVCPAGMQMWGHSSPACTRRQTQELQPPPHAAGNTSSLPLSSLLPPCRALFSLFFFHLHFPIKTLLVSFRQRSCHRVGEVTLWTSGARSASAGAPSGTQICIVSTVHSLPATFLREDHLSN